MGFRVAVTIVDMIATVASKSMIESLLSSGVVGVGEADGEAVTLGVGLVGVELTGGDAVFEVSEGVVEVGRVELVGGVGLTAVFTITWVESELTAAPTVSVI